MRSRIAVLAAALVAAAIGTALITGVVGGGEAPPAGATQSVLVALERIEPGTTGEAARTSVQRREIPAEALVPGVLTDLDGVAQLRAVGPILPGEQVVAGQWSESAFGALRPPRGQLGLSVQLGDPERVAGFVTPGASVAVFATTAERGGASRTRLLLAPVTVLGVGGTTLTTRTTSGSPGEATSTEQVPTAILTLALTQQEAERVVFAQGQGSLHLALMGPGFRAAPSAGVTVESLFGGP